MTPRQDIVKLLLVEELPRLVVVGSKGVCQSPMSHGAVEIMGNGLFEASGCLFVVEGIAPCQATIEPDLRIAALRVDGSLEGS